MTLFHLKYMNSTASPLRFKSIRLEGILWSVQKFDNLVNTEASSRRTSL